MGERPIIFCAPMVRALLDTRKTQTRRVIKPQPGPFDALFSEGGKWWDGDAETGEVHAYWNVPYAPGDRLWVREAWSHTGEGVWTIADARTRLRGRPIYRADHEEAKAAGPRVDVKWWPSIHMPREFSRITLLVTKVRVQRLQEITPADAIAEGIPAAANSQTIDCDTPNPCDGFRTTWNSIHGAGAWDANPWVAALTFTVERPAPEDGPR